MNKSVGHPFRPGVELLETREVPASFTASNVAELIADIDAANLTPEADTITLVAGSTFTLTEVNNTTSGPTGLPVISAGENLTIVGNGDVIERSSATGTPAFRLLDVATGGSLTLHDLTLQGGLAIGSPIRGIEWFQGGAIYNHGTLVLENVIVQNNTAQGYAASGIGYGGFVGASSGQGGGLYSDGMLIVSDSTLQGNAAIGGRGINALRSGPPNVTGGVGLPNVGGPGGNGLGGGLYVAGGTVTISDSTVSDNTVRGGNGGNGFVKKSGTTTAAGDGGDGLGGGIYAANGAISLHHVTVTENHAIGGLGGTANPVNLVGEDGRGIGGGIYIISDASVGLDQFTVNKAKKNDATTSHRNIRGSYDVIS